MTDSCSNCRFSLPGNAPGQLLCRAGPPQVIATQYIAQPAQLQPAVTFRGKGGLLNDVGSRQGWILQLAQTEAHFPPMRPNGWCGAHKPKE